MTTQTTTNTPQQTNGEAPQQQAENVPMAMPAQSVQRTGGPTTDMAIMSDPQAVKAMWWYAKVLAGSTIVPQNYQGNESNCFIALLMAHRMGADALMVMQHTHVIHGRPGIDAQFALSLMNTSGLFENSIDYEIEGDDPFDENYRVRAVATRKSTGKEIHGPWIDWKLVRGEGWDSKSGSKWKTMPGQMFIYRAAMFFGRAHCPERLMGMHTRDEIEDIGPENAPTPQLPPNGRTRFGLGHRKAFDPEQVNTETGELDTSPDSSADAETPPDDATSATAEHSADEASDTQPDNSADASGEPTPADKLVMLLAEKCECNDVDARAELETQAGMSLEKLSAKSIRDLEKRVRSGDIAV